MRWIAFIVLALTTLSCASTGVPQRAQVRGAVVLGAEAVKATDKLCGDVARERQDLGLAQRCAHGYEVARGAMVITAIAVDHWDDSSTARRSVQCASRDIVEGLSAMVRELRAIGVKPPPLVDDAFAAAQMFGVCPDVVPVPALPDGGA